MRFAAFLGTLVTAYLIATLCASSLAKLKNFRVSYVGILRERVLPARVAAFVVAVVIICEFSLAVLLAINFMPGAVHDATAGLFIAFGCYRVAVALKTKALMCSCAGTLRSEAASPAALSGVFLACLALGAVSYLSAFAGRLEGTWVGVFVAGVWLSPFLALVFGYCRRILMQRPGTRWG